MRTPFLVHFASIVVSSAIALGAFLGTPGPAGAQADSGEFLLRQGGTCGWLYVSADGSTEWWAYIEGEYEWADSGSTGSNTWQGELEYIGSGPWSSYAGWKADVLGRAAAQGHSITFQQHAVEAETIEN